MPAPVEGVTASCLTPGPRGNGTDPGALIGVCPPGTLRGLAEQEALTHSGKSKFCCCF